MINAKSNRETQPRSKGYDRFLSWNMLSNIKEIKKIKIIFKSKSQKQLTGKRTVSCPK